ncbi:hypothetical protein HNY73_021524 [Argiope bruennichi]|uniref:Uncharacterized protein n=1 Tax=Argiope bruennichi TaxID=94029 RepID=A0A8T0DZF0_ARGBR|nr:hypothetical protein HNY73_021524 [Argiope bruennichi]
MIRNRLIRFIRHYLTRNAENNTDTNTSNSVNLLQKLMELLTVWIHAMTILRSLLVDEILHNLLIRIMEIYLPLDGEHATTLLQMFIDFLTNSTSPMISLQIILSNEIVQGLLIFLIDYRTGQNIWNNPANTTILTILQMIISFVTLCTVAMTYLQVILSKEIVRKLLPMLVEFCLPQSGVGNRLCDSITSQLSSDFSEHSSEQNEYPIGVPEITAAHSKYLRRIESESIALRNFL